MATAIINWTPGEGDISLSQDIHCKALSDAVWEFIANVSASTDSAEIADRQDNVVYQFRITNNCSGEVMMFSNIAEGANITCPDEVYVNVNGLTSVGFYFVGLGGDVDSYFVELLSVDDEVLETQTLSDTLFVSSSWEELTPGTDYKMRISPQATGALDVYSTTCAPIPFSTSTPFCPAPMDVVAEVLLSCPAPTDVSAEAWTIVD